MTLSGLSMQLSRWPVSSSRKHARSTARQVPRCSRRSRDQRSRSGPKASGSVDGSSGRGGREGQRSDGGPGTSAGTASLGHRPTTVVDPGGAKLPGAWAPGMAGAVMAGAGWRDGRSGQGEVSGTGARAAPVAMACGRVRDGGRSGTSSGRAGRRSAGGCLLASTGSAAAFGGCARDACRPVFHPGRGLCRRPLRPGPAQVGRPWQPSGARGRLGHPEIGRVRTGRHVLPRQDPVRLRAHRQPQGPRVGRSRRRDQRRRVGGGSPEPLDLLAGRAVGAAGGTPCGAFSSQSDAARTRSSQSGGGPDRHATLGTAVGAPGASGSPGRVDRARVRPGRTCSGCRTV